MQPSDATKSVRPRRVRFASTVDVREHALQIGDFKLCVPTVFRNYAVCESRVPVQLSDEVVSSYKSPLLHQATKIALPLNTQQQVDRLISMGLSKSHIQARINRFWDAQKNVCPPKEDSVDQEAEDSCSMTGRLDSINNWKIPRMFVNGLNDRLQEASWLDECKVETGARWYQFCQKYFRAHRAQSDAVLRARALRKELYKTDSVFREIRKKLYKEEGKTDSTTGRKRPFDTASGSWVDPID